MKCIVLAYGNLGTAGLEAVLRHGFEVAAVITHADDPQETVWFDSVAECAARHGIEVHAPVDVNDPIWVARLRSLGADAIFSFQYRTLLKPELLALAPNHAYNLHPSLLPSYRGRCPVNWVLVHGERETGVTLHHMTARPDDGDIVGQRSVSVADDDTALTLSRSVREAADTLLDDLLPRIRRGDAPRSPQDQNRATTFGGRRPQDGEIDWTRSARDVRNLVRAVTRPWPGAFTWAASRKCLVWEATVVESPSRSAAETVAPGTVLSTSPLVVACGGDDAQALRIDLAEPEGGVLSAGAHVARELHLVEGTRLERRTRSRRDGKTNVLILGADGFIGCALSERLLESGRYRVFAMDLNSTNIAPLQDHPDFRFVEGDISIHREWIEYHVKKCDVVLPLVAIATPVEYIRNPLGVFELDFEQNLSIVRYCVKYRKRLIFPSTSEVYGMCPDSEFDEDASNFVLGPIHRQRWIYSCSKQLLDRVIWAYGMHHDLRFTLFRPFNWIGPRLDSLDAARIGSSRVITQLILNLVEGTPIQLLDGGRQRRCFTDVNDGIECLFRIIEREDGACDGQILNIGNPDNDASIGQLATLLVDQFERHPLRHRFPPFAGFQEIESRAYYGEGYEDVGRRTPSIRKACRLVGWKPEVGLERAVERTLDYFLRQTPEATEPDQPEPPAVTVTTTRPREQTPAPAR